MMHNNKMTIFLVSFITLLVFVGVILGHLFILPPGRASIVWPALGLVFGFRYHFGRKIWPYLMAGYFGGYAVSELLISQRDFYMSVLVALVMTVVLVVAVTFGMVVVRLVRYRPRVTLFSSLKYVGIALSIALFTSISGSIFYALIGYIPFTRYFTSVSIWVLGDFFSVIGFGLPVIYSLQFDKRGPSAQSRLSMVVYAVFIIVVIGLLTDVVPLVNFRNHKYVFTLFAFVLAFYLPYRTIYIFHFIVLTAMIVFTPFDGFVNHLRLMMEVNLFLALMTVMTITIKYHMQAINDNKETISLKSQRLDLLLNALDNLLAMPSESNKLEHRNINDHLKQMFHMVYTLFDKADYGSCMIINHTIEFIDSIGFDVEVLNRLELTGKTQTSYHLEDPYIQTQAETFLKEDLGDDNYAIYKETNPTIKESIYVGFRISKDVVCEMSFDLQVDSQETYTQDDLDFFSSLQTLFSSFYDTEKVTREYSVLKNDIILSLLRTLELFDKQAGVHSMDVALLAQALAEKMGLHEGMVNDIYWAGIVHDIGKLGMDTKLLKKEGLYTVNEYEAMQKHPLLSYQILAKSEELKSIASIVKHHHESVDGSGYPDQLTDNEIPLPSKILHIAEAVAVMMRDWSYQAAFTEHAIVEELGKKKGTQFDSMCADAMIAMIRDSLLDDIKDTNRAD